METVLVAVDWSPRDERALGVGARLAERFDADLWLLRAAPDLHIETEVERLRRLATRNGLFDAQVAVFTGEPTASAVTHACRRSSDTVLVLATGGQPCVDSADPGDGADEIVRRLDDPLVLVGPLVEDRGDWSSIVIFWDGSFASAAAAPVAAGWARALDLPLYLVHVRAPGSAPVVTGTSPDGATLADRVVRAATVDGREPVVVEVVDDEPATGASRFCRSLSGSALVVLAALGATGPPARVLGRFTLQLAREGPHALLVCHHPH